MAGYATLSPALAGGWVVWAVGGTLLPIGSIFAVREAVKYSDASTESTAERNEKNDTVTTSSSISGTQTNTCTGATQNCDKKMTATVHVYTHKAKIAAEKQAVQLECLA